MADVIGAKLDLVAVFGQGGRMCHDACIAKEDVETSGLRGETFGCRSRGGKRGKVALDERNIGAWCDCLGSFNHFGGGGLVAAGEEDVFWMMLGKLIDGFLPQACGAFMLVSKVMWWWQRCGSVLPPVTRITLPVREGMSLVGSNGTLFMVYGMEMVVSSVCCLMFDY